MPLPPKARFRLYTSPRSYFGLGGDILLGRLGRGDDVARLEAELCRRLGVAHAVCAPRCRTGLYFVLKAHFERTALRRVVLSPYTIADVVNMVVLAGGVPVFADLDANTCNPSAVEISKLVDDQTAAVLVTHLHGLICDIEPVAALCRARGVLLVEDVAQAFGARLGGRMAGSLGDVGVFSFGAFKNVNAWHGGAVASNDTDLMERVRKLAEAQRPETAGSLLKRAGFSLLKDIATFPPVFRAFTFWVFRYGHLHQVKAINNFVQTELNAARLPTMPDAFLRRLTPGQARLILSQLGRMDDLTRTRVEHAKLYADGLAGLPGIGLPPAPDGFRHIYLYYPIHVPNRDALLTWLMKNMRDVGAHHYKNCAELPGFSDFRRACPNATRTSQELVLLPTYPTYGREEVARTIAAVRSFRP